jgi:hypothetical protein
MMEADEDRPDRCRSDYSDSNHSGTGGAPLAANYIFGVAWLYFVMPVLFAISIRTFGRARPFGRLLKDVVLFAVYTQ